MLAFNVKPVQKRPLLFALFTGKNKLNPESRTQRRCVEVCPEAKEPTYTDLTFWNTSRNNMGDMSMAKFNESAVMKPRPLDLSCSKRDSNRNDNRFMLAELRHNGKLKMNTHEKRVTSKPQQPVATFKMISKERAPPPSSVEAGPVKHSRTVQFRPASQADLSKLQKRENDARILHVAHS